GKNWEAAVDYWRSLTTDDGATFDKEVVIDAASLKPPVSWATNPSRVVTIDGSVPDPTTESDERALAYMGLTAGTPIREINVDTVVIGSGPNSRIEDLRAAAAVVEGKNVKSGLRAMVVPGSMKVKAQAEEEGLDRVFSAAGF